MGELILAVTKYKRQKEDSQKAYAQQRQEEKKESREGSYIHYL
jgi:hypothetical protein